MYTVAECIHTYNTYLSAYIVYCKSYKYGKYGGELSKVHTILNNNYNNIIICMTCVSTVYVGILGLIASNSLDDGILSMR